MLAVISEDVDSPHSAAMIFFIARYSRGDQGFCGSRDLRHVPKSAGAIAKPKETSPPKMQDERRLVSHLDDLPQTLLLQDYTANITLFSTEVAMVGEWL